jgi:hypothetical protein
MDKEGLRRREVFYFKGHDERGLNMTELLNLLMYQAVWLLHVYLHY